jgi:uncharacterized protein YjbI with pentapeptide repeats
VDLTGAHLEGANLRGAHLEGASLSGAHFEGANLSGAHLEYADLVRTYLEGADVSEADLGGASLRLAYADGADMRLAQLAGVDLRGAQLSGADLRFAHLEGADLSAAHLEGKRVTDEEWERVRIWKRNFEKVLPAADLRSAFLDASTVFRDVTLGNATTCVSVADMHWGGANLATIDWNSIPVLGDELAARLRTGSQRPTSRDTRLNDLHAAVRANRQLAVALREQGLNEEADVYAYRAQACQRAVIWRRRRFGSFWWSTFLNLLAGYGYRPRRSFAAYLLVVVGFSVAYYLIGAQVGQPLSPLGALVFSVTSFHGRGFFPAPSSGNPVTLDNPLVVLAAAEAFTGLIIELSFIATFTQRFFAR